MKIKFWGTRGSIPTPISPTAIEGKIRQALRGAVGIDLSSKAAINRDGLRVLKHILDRQLNTRTIIVTSSNPKRIRREVAEIASGVSVLWKDQWDDEQFLAIVDEFFANKET